MSPEAAPARHRRERKGEWVRLGPAPYFATCTRCGGHIDHPPLPMPLGAFKPFCDYAIALHEHCKPGDGGP